MDFARIPADWPFRNRMRRVRARPHDWCVLDVGTGPTVVMLHGAGGSGHSFRHLIPHLARNYRLIVPDLPGQGFSRSGNRGRLGLDGMAEDIARLCTAEGVHPDFAIGHSAGAAVALRLAEIVSLRGIIGINAALGSFEGAAGIMFPLLAKVLAVTPFVSQAVSRMWGTASTVRRLLASTGSPLEAQGQAQYLTLVSDSAHVDGTLAMMAQWKLDPLLARLPALATPTLLIAAKGDKAVPARVSRDAAARLPAARYAELPRYGHLVHEEAASEVADLILPWMAGLRA